MTEITSWLTHQGSIWYPFVATLGFLFTFIYWLYRKYLHPIGILIRTQLEYNGGGSLVDKVYDLHNWKPQVDKKLEELHLEIQDAQCKNLCPFKERERTF